MIKIYNTLTREKEVFQPIQENKVSMYVCGPTVYNYIHIGNARSTIAFDTVRRYFDYRGYEVNYVSNFTDVDDKIIRTAKELNLTAPEVADRFIAAFKEDTQALNVLPATLHPRVMDHMPDIITFIEALIEKGYAYESSGDVYYRTRKFDQYGQLSDQSVDELEVGASQRMGAEQQLKEDPLDFALWKSAKVDEISWDSPWGKGRPGWHIECSVMATKHLGETIDIHGGGQDLEFPHHENEIAQSEAKTGKKFANYWMHNGYVTIGDDDEKMSKSLGNFVTVHELVKEVDPQVLRFFMATTQYRRPIRYSETTLKEAATNLQKLRTAYENTLFRLATAQETGAANGTDDAQKIQELTVLEERFVAEMDDDFNTANGLTVIYELAKWLNTYSESAEVSAAVLSAGVEKYRQWLAIFGIVFVSDELLDEEIDQLIEERIQARKNRDFARSDEIRDQLKEQGIILEDTPQGTRWRRE
ncbi:cysteine--tRNA ligase [Enterococcus sp. JM4C]|uniref:cysteine--tRNA ligase n=1 Tax=Candidatus Enterococcus huntleyi TaxID=1857217 RepID=UPI00137A8409|nr:cysteine--tRNA ligase [Enterococcus sp. JM4C]KAF1295141.1 cysteine--tRNA ligase [Enterococcus sp. JM4C]